MQLSVTFTVNDRPHYFEEVLSSWNEVRSKEDVFFYFNCEHIGVERDYNPSVVMAEKWLKDNKVVGRVYQNSEKFGVGHNPYVALQRAFGNQQVDYAILAEDDLLVADDIIEYHKWASEHFKSHTEITTVHSWRQSGHYLSDPGMVTSGYPFMDSLVWGTWRDRWVDILEPTWDHNYNTGWGNKKGWDWNLRERILPPMKKQSIYPMISKVQNIGAVGTHATGTNYPRANYFASYTEKDIKYTELV